MATKKTKIAAALTTVTTMSSSQYIPLTDGSGNMTKISLANLKASLLAGISLSAINEGVFIMYHRTSDDYPLAVAPESWTSLQSSGQVADGVLVVEGGRMLVVAPTEASSDGLLWSSTSVSGGGKTTTGRVTAFNDWDGKANTAAQITHTECSSVSYAPGFCAKYSRANANGAGLTAGRWWLPSMGELMMMWANIKKINYALSFISGAVQLPSSAHWSSTEFSSTTAWLLGLGDGNAINRTKSSDKRRVRPVSAF